MSLREMSKTKKLAHVHAKSQLFVTKFRTSMHAALRTISVYLKD